MTDNTDIVTRMAKEASESEPVFWGYDEQEAGQINAAWLSRFAAIVAEDCAKLVEEQRRRDPDDDTNDSYFASGANIASEFAASAIRARFKA